MGGGLLVRTNEEGLGGSWGALWVQLGPVNHSEGRTGEVVLGPAQPWPSGFHAAATASGAAPADSLVPSTFKKSCMYFFTSFR